MTLVQLAFAYICHRRLASSVAVVCVALGAALILLVLGVRRELERNFLAQGRRYDLLVGAPGSEVALVLATLFQAESVRGNLPLRVSEQIGGLEGVTAAYPLCLGDEYRGARILGTTTQFLMQDDGAGGVAFKLNTGRLFRQDFEVVAGAEAAQRLGLALDATLVSTHAAAARSLEHREFPYTVVGVLEPTGTPFDRALFTSMASYWRVHAKGTARTPPRLAEQEISALLLRVARPRMFQLQQQIAQQFGVAAVRPVDVLTRLFEQVLSPLERVLLAFAGAAMAVATATVLGTLWLATLMRLHDLAILRAVGATRREIFLLVVLETLILMVIGVGLGALGSRGMILLLRRDLESRFGVQVDPLAFTPLEAGALLVLLGVGGIAALLPAAYSYRGDVARWLRAR